MAGNKLTMWRPSLVKLSNGTSTYYLSDHNRDTLTESYEMIEKSARTANGTLRKYVIASKKTWSTSWTMLPGASPQTVDGYMGALDLKDFYDSNIDNTLTLEFYTGRSIPITSGAVTFATNARTYNGLPTGHGLVVGQLLSVTSLNPVSSTLDIVNARITAVATNSVTVSTTDSGTGTITSGYAYVNTSPKGITAAASSYTATVVISSFSRTISKRLGDIDYWDCDIEFVEV